MLDPYSNNYSYEKWISSNRKYLKVYFEKHDMTIDLLELPAELYSVLKYNQIRNLADVAFLSEPELKVLNYSNPRIAKNIGRYCFSYLKDVRDQLVAYVIECESIEKDSLAQCSVSVEDAEEILINPTKREEFKKYLESYPTPVESIVLSTRTYNGLKRARVNTLLEAMEYYPDRFTAIRNMGATSAAEIKNAVLEEAAKYFGGMEAPSDIASSVVGEVEEVDTEHSHTPTSIQQALFIPGYKEKVIQFVGMFDVTLEAMKLSARPYGALARAQLTTLSKILNKYPLNPSSFNGLGTKSFGEIENEVQRHLEKLNDGFMSFLNGDMESMFSDELLCSEIMALYDSKAFVGYSFDDFRSVVNESVSDERLRGIIGSLLAEKKLEYVDFRCYKVYPSFYEYLKKYCDLAEGDAIRNANIVSMFYAGKTLEEIGKEVGITRERARQIAVKETTKIKSFYAQNTHSTVFDEDYYEYLFTTYALDKEAWLDYIGVSIDSYNYLKRTYKRGENSNINDAIADAEVAVNLKFRLLDYINKDKLSIDGKLFNPSRSDIEDYIIRTYCIEDTKWDDFCELYNSVLKKNRIPETSEVYYTKEVERTRFNRLAECMVCLWKTGKTLRAYDIQAREYSELIDALGIENYENTGVSTLKWFNDYPELMEEYDIRDQYELHNLLKKIIPNGSYHDIQFERQPGVSFGDFNRDADIYELMVANAPISKEKLADIVYEIYGYDRGSCMANYFVCIDNYYHEGVYSIDFKTINAERLGYLKTILTEDFYYYSEVKKLYRGLYPDADEDEINPRSLKMLGFQSYSNYILKNYNSLTEYFTYLLTKDEVFDYKQYKNRFALVLMFTQLSYEMRRDFDIMLYGNGMAISIKRLEKLGITKKQIADYCSNVVNFVEQGEYFSIHSLRKHGFNDELENLGFDDEFYEGILESYSEINTLQCSNTKIFVVGEAYKEVQRKDFLASIVEDNVSISKDDFEEILVEEFGMMLAENFYIQNCLTDTDIYYDSIMEKFYIDKNTYYDELS